MDSKYHMTGFLKKYALFLLVVGAVGFIDASFLAVEYLLGKVPPCTLVQGCDVVTRSQYATIFGIPISVLGALYYLCFVIAAVWYLDKKNTQPLMVMAKLSVFGFLFSMYLVGLQLFVLKAICVYCMYSATTSTALFIGSMVFLKKSQITVAAHSD